MANTPLGTDPAKATALPVQVPGQQLGSITTLPRSIGGFSQVQRVDAARQQMQSGVITSDPVRNPLFTSNGNSNGYQESRYLPGGYPQLGPLQASSVARSTIQGFTYMSLSDPQVFGGSISANTPPAPGNTYQISRL